MDHDTRLKLYSTRNSIAPSQSITSNSQSLFSLVAFAENQSWKTGILQRCIDFLVTNEFRQNASVYAIIDEQYQRLLRFKLETEVKGIPNCTCPGLVMVIRRIIELLGLRHSRDTSVFSNIPESIYEHIDMLKNLSMILTCKGSIIYKLSEVLSLWCGTRVIKCEDGYRIEVDEDVTVVLAYMQPFLERPAKLAILEEPM